MSEPIALLSSAVISQNELLSFIVQSQDHPTSDISLFGRLSRGECHIWIGLSPEELAAALEDNGESYLRELTSLLGTPPQTYVVVEISRVEGSELLALDFAISFCKRWPTVVEADHHLLTCDELLQRRETGQGIRAIVAAS